MRTMKCGSDYCTKTKERWRFYFYLKQHYRGKYPIRVRVWRKSGPIEWGGEEHPPQELLDYLTMTRVPGGFATQMFSSFEELRSCLQQEVKDRPEYHIRLKNAGKFEQEGELTITVRRARKVKNGIGSLKELLDARGEESEGQLKHHLYKYTTCGIGCSTNKDGISLSGYCEGTDAECPEHFLPWGAFDMEEFDRVVERADHDGCDLWDETHGCPSCWNRDDQGKPTALDPEPEDWTPGTVDPECAACGGHGIVL